MAIMGCLSKDLEPNRQLCYKEFEMPNPEDTLEHSKHDPKQFSTIFRSRIVRPSAWFLSVWLNKGKGLLCVTSDGFSQVSKRSKTNCRGLFWWISQTDSCESVRVFWVHLFSGTAVCISANQSSRCTGTEACQPKHFKPTTAVPTRCETCCVSTQFYFRWPMEWRCGLCCEIP